jgi:hypothetical protein
VHDMTPRQNQAGFETKGISRQALKALSNLEGLPGGPLSPLSSMRQPQGPARADELLAAWESLQGAWRWAVPALLDPHYTVAFLSGDGNVNRLGQYVFPDAEAYGPGFEVTMEEENMNLTGPLSLEELGVGFHSRLAWEEVGEPVQFRMNLAAYHFRALTACLDAYRSTALARRLLRSGGAPVSVGIGDILEAWADGTTMLNPGWTVSLFQLLAPAEAPVDLAKALPRLLQEMSRAGYLLQEKDAASGEARFSFADSLEPLLWGLTNALHFGLAVRRLRQPQTAEVTILGGWRIPDGIWMADLSDMENSGVTLILAGPELASDLIDEMLGDDSLAPSWEDFIMDTSYSHDAVISGLRHRQAEEEASPADAEVSGRESVPGSPSFCARCGQPLQDKAKFCRGCGTPVRRSHEVKSAEGQGVEKQRSCPKCGYICPGSAKFCRGCGLQL